MADIKKIKIGSTSYNVKDQVARDTLDDGIISTGRYYNPDVFTIVGTPIISDDGIASGFSRNNYINTILLPYDKLNYCITLKDYKYLGGQSFIFGNRNIANEQSLNVIFDANKILLFASSTGTSWNIANGVTSSSTFISGNTYDVSFVRENGSLYKVVVYDHSNNTTTTEVTVTTNSNLFNSPNLIAIGAGSWQPYTGSIDLKQFSITVNGNEVLDGSKYLIQDGNLDVETVNEKMHALKCYPDKGELLTDRQGLEAVKSYNRSTFDLSKFTVLGNSTITDDGIASGATVLSSSNIDLSSSPTKWTIISPKYKITTPVTTVLILFQWGNATTGNVNFALRPNGVIGMNYNHTTGTGVAQTSVQGVVPTNTDIQCKWEYDNGAITLSYKFGNAEWMILGQTNVSACTSSGAVELSRTNSNGCTCDLKTGSFIVDGVEVFNGNKTGVDTIKPDDFTVVGTPTISADGVASGFSNSNYFTLPYDWANNCTNFKFNIKFHTDTLSSTKQYLIGYTSNDFGCGLNINSSNQLAWYAWRDTDNSTVTQMDLTTTLSNNTDYIVECILNNGVYSLNLYDANNILIESKTASTSYNFNISSRFRLGNDGQYYIAQPFINGSIDLNAFKIYVDDNLVYQPLLRIPYNQSKTGSKIVQSAYRDRVQDMYNQFGWANYYTLLEERKPHYNIVGTPTISSDYVASGFSNSNYLTKALSDVKNDFEILCPVKYTTISSNLENLYIFYNSSTILGRIRKEANGSLSINMTDASSNIVISMSELVSSSNMTANKTYYVKFTCKQESTNYRYKVDISDDLKSWINKVNVLSQYQVVINGFNIGTYSNGSPATNGSIDLKQFSITVDNNLVYQAVEEPNFTLPMGELYGFMSHGSGDVSVDNNTIISSNGTISAVGLKNSNTNNNTVKTWTGTIDQYNAISTKDATTLYMITDDDTSVTTPILQTIYPVGSIYITTNSTCPLAALFGTWELVASDMVLQGAGTRGTVGTTLPESLPNITGKLTIGNASDGGYWIGNMQMSSGCVVPTNYCNTAVYCNNTTSNKTGYASASIDASKSSSVYTNGATHVQPSAYLVNIFRRTA